MSSGRDRWYGRWTRSNGPRPAAASCAPAGRRGRARGGRGGASSPVDGWRGAVLLVADVLAPRDGTALVVDFLHRYVGHEAVGGGAVPVVLAGIEEHAVTRADHLALSVRALGVKCTLAAPRRDVSVGVATVSM